MSFWNTFIEWMAGCNYSADDTNTWSETHGHNDIGCLVNPGSGLPMLNGSCMGLDVAGNPYGMDLHQNNDWSSASSWNEPFSGTQSSWDGGIDGGSIHD